MAEIDSSTAQAAAGADGDGGVKSEGSPPRRESAEHGSGSSPKAKRRKVNHACLYCRRSHMTCDLERPCTRCIKRNIGHLCHDEPREAVKKGKPGHGGGAALADGGDGTQPDDAGGLGPALGQQLLQESDAGLASIRSAVPSAAAGLDPLNGSVGSLGTGDEWRLTGQNPFHDIHTYHPSYMFNAPEVTNEYNLLNDFLSTSLLDEGGGAGGVYDGDLTAMYSDAGAAAVPAAMAAPVSTAAAPPPAAPQALGPPLAPASSIKRASSAAPPTEKAQENYYLTAADPTDGGERLGTLLQAKYNAGLLRPFNYVKGYARLNRYMEKHIHPDSRQKILRQLDKFRPKFRERMQSLTDVELVLVEMWFERCLMEYDRVFASMAIPACCWRRTGEIFRGNKEMAELIHVPIESLRDGKLALHDIIIEDHLVSYWQKFGAIAFNNSQKAMLTSCSLKNPDGDSKYPHIPCCFSFTIRRDEHNIPSLIVGNFLPMKPKSKD